MWISGAAREVVVVARGCYTVMEDKKGIVRQEQKQSGRLEGCGQKDEVNKCWGI